MWALEQRMANGVSRSSASGSVPWTGSFGPCRSTSQPHRVMLLVADRDVPVINEDGELLAEFTINPTKNYQTQKRPGQPT